MIEDEQEEARLIQDRLADCATPFSVDRVSYLAAGLARLEPGGFDLILADLTLPDSSGMETVSALIERAPGVPVVVLAGVADEELAAQAVRAGAEDFLVKGEVDAGLLACSLRRAIERQSSEAVVARSRLQVLFDHALEGMLLADDEGRFVAANPAAEALTGYPRDELVGMTVGDLSPNEDHERRRELWEDFMRTGQQRGEGLLVRKDGSVAAVEYRAVANVYPGLHVSFLEDLSAQRRAEEENRHQIESYRRFFEEDLTGDAVATPDGRIVTCNPAFAQIFGFDSVEAALRSTLPDLFPDRDLRCRFLRRIHQEGKLDRFEMEGRRCNGEPVFLIANVIGTFGPSGELLDLHGYLFDDTERHKAEQQLRQAQKMEAVGLLAGGIAHDFNNLVTAITGYSDLLLTSLAPNAPERHDLQEIRRAGERAAELTRQLLAFSRRQVMQPTVLDLNEVVVGTESMLQRLLGEEVRLLTKTSRETGRVRTDRGQLEQVIMNLAVNAHDAMPCGGELILQTEPILIKNGFSHSGVSVEPGEYAVLAVTDSGEGMTPDVAARIFEPFFTTKERGRGTGLGLSTAYGIIKQSGGYIFVDSEPGQGTTFKVYLPRVEAERTPEQAPDPDRTSHGHGEVILVVEDEGAVRKLIVHLLRLRGFAVLDAPNGREALRICGEQERIDLVISDVVMPDMRGPDLGAALAEVLPDTRLLYISGYPGASIARRGELPESTPFLQKPFTHDELVNTVCSLLHTSGANAQP